MRMVSRSFNVFYAVEMAEISIDLGTEVLMSKPCGAKLTPGSKYFLVRVSWPLIDYAHLAHPLRKCL